VNSPRASRRWLPGQIITSLETVELFELIQKMDCRRLYSIPVKGKEKPRDLRAMCLTARTRPRCSRTHGAEEGALTLRLIPRQGDRAPAERCSLVLPRRDRRSDADRMPGAHCEIEQRRISL
jgi:hypothetical protein